MHKKNRPMLCGLYLLPFIACAAFLPASALPAPPDSGEFAFSRALWPGAFQQAAGLRTTDVPFAARGKRYLARVRSDGFAVSRQGPGMQAIQVTFAGSKAGRQAVFDRPAATRVRIFSKLAAAISVQDIRRYEKVSYASVYPGIDAIYRADAENGDLELDFAVKPGSDPAQIRLIAGAGTRFEWATNHRDVMAVNGQMRFQLKQPVAFQWIGGIRRDVHARFAISEGTARFELGDYDRAHELIIDPLVASYSTFIGTVTDAFYDSVRAIATDSNGNVYVGGLTQFDLNLSIETGFPGAPGSLLLQNPRSPGNDCAFQCGYILKLDADHQVVYGALLASLDVQALAVDPNGNAYATGQTNASAEFPATAGAFSNDPIGHAFVVKLNAAGTALGYAALFRGTIGRAIAADAAGNAYVAGDTDQQGLPTTPGALKPDYQSTGDTLNREAFLLKINQAGSAVVFGTYLGGSAADNATGLVLAHDDSPIVVGRSSSSDFTGISAASAGEGDAFVAHVAADGSSLIAGKFLGGSGDDGANSIASDGQGGYLVAGATQSADFPITTGTLQQRLLGSRNGWLARLNADLSTRYATYFGGSFIDGFLGVAGDPSGRAYTIGTTFSSDLQTTADGFQDVSTAFTGSLLAGIGPRFYPIAHDATREAYFGVFNADGTRLEYGTYLGGYYTVPRGYAPLVFGSSIARASDGSVFVGGYSDAASFPILDGGIGDQMKGNADGFLVRFEQRDFSISSPTLLPAAKIDQPYTYQLQATGGAAPYRWRLVGFRLPDGLQLATDGRITGTPTSGQTESWGYQFSVSATDAAGRVANKSVFMNLNWPGNPVCTPNSCSMSVLMNQPFIYDMPFLARGVPPFTLYYSAPLPPGIQFDVQQGTFGGNPTTAGNYSFSLRMVDAVGAEGTIDWQIEVRGPDAPTPNPPANPPAGNNDGSESGRSGGGGGSLSLLELLALLAALALLRSGDRPAQRAARLTRTG
jgi:hypothetical protein